MTSKKGLGTNSELVSPFRWLLHLCESSKPLNSHLHSTSVKLVQLHACKGKEIERHITNCHDVSMKAKRPIQILAFNPFKGISPFPAADQRCSCSGRLSHVGRWV